MHWRLVAVLTAALLCVGWGRAPLSQNAPPAGTQRRHVPPDSQKVLRPPGFSKLQISVWYGHSLTPGGLLGTISDNRLSLLGLRVSRRLLPTATQLATGYDAPTLTYTADLIPFASVHVPREAAPSAYYLNGSQQRQALSTKGFGLYPVGLLVAFWPTSHLRPFLTGHTGVLHFFDPVPDGRGKQLNFAVGIGGGAEVSIAPRATLTVAYRYHHLSNGFRGSINPGLDANLLYLRLGVAL